MAADPFVCNVTDGDTAWIMIASVLVLTMIPGLAFFESGMLRAKNSLSIIVIIFSACAILCVMWLLFGYSITFGGRSVEYLPLSNLLFIDVSTSVCAVYATKVPEAAFAVFQMMFAAICPLLVTGASAERITYKGNLTFIVLFECLIYYPVAHWIWGQGWLSTMGVQDFAGGIVIHATAGVASLVIAVYLGQRKNFVKYEGEFPPHNLPFAGVGVCFLWIGWFGFNAGSAYEAGQLSVNAVASTQVGVCSSMAVWILFSTYSRKEFKAPTASDCFNGALAGLAGITPACGFISIQYSLLVGIVLGALSWFGVKILKSYFRIDDALDVSMVHGLTGIIGALSTGFFGDKRINPAGKDGLFFGSNSGHLLWVQFVGVAVVCCYTAVVSYICCVLANFLVGGMRLPESCEKLGADWSEHREFSYHDMMIDENILKKVANGNQLPLTRDVVLSSATEAGGAINNKHDKHGGDSPHASKYVRKLSESHVEDAEGYYQSSTLFQSARGATNRRN